MIDRCTCYDNVDGDFAITLSENIHPRCGKPFICKSEAKRLDEQIPEWKLKLKALMEKNDAGRT